MPIIYHKPDPASPLNQFNKGPRPWERIEGPEATDDDLEDHGAEKPRTALPPSPENPGTPRW